MSTLKQLVDETTNIKNELVTCHANLKNNLLHKNIDFLPTDKFSTLISKIKNITNVKAIEGEDYLIFTSNTKYSAVLNNGVFENVYNHENLFIDGNYRLIFNLRSRMAGRSLTCKIEHTRNGEVLRTIKQTHKSPNYDEVVTTYKFDIVNVQKRDVFKFYVSVPNNTAVSDVYLAKITFRCNLEFSL